MGSSGSKPSPGPKLFYLVFGSPTITCRRGPDNGPLIFNVEPMQQHIQPPESAESRECALYCSMKQPFRLVRATASGVTAGYRLQFTVDSSAVPFVVRVFANVALDYEHSDGFGIKRHDDDQRQFLVSEQHFEAGTNILFDVPHMPMDLSRQPTDTTQDDVFSRLATSPIAIELTYGGGRESDADSPKTKLFLFLKYNPTDLDATESASIPAACTKQYFFCGGDLFELDDIFDMKGDTAPPKAQEAGGQGDEVPVDDEDVSCVICLTNDRDTTIIPCRHMCVCAECAALLQQQSNKCPMCRRDIEKLLTLHTGA